MTLPYSERKSQLYTADGVQRRFDFPFRSFYDENSGDQGIEVRKQLELDYEVILPSQYDVFNNSDMVGGYVLFNTAPEAGTVIYIAGKTPVTQQLNLANYGRFSAESIETALDVVVAMIQEWISGLSEERRQRILGDANVINVTYQRYNELKSWVMQEFPDIAEDTFNGIFQEFYKQWQDALNQVNQNKFPASIVFDASGLNQQEINDQWVNVTSLLLSGNTVESKIHNKSILETAIAKAKAEAKGIYCAPRGIAYLDADIDFRGITQIQFYTHINNPSGTIRVGGDANKGSPTNIVFCDILNGTSAISGAVPSKPTFQINGIKTGRVIVGNTNHLNIHASPGAATNSNAYFELYASATRYVSVTDEGTGCWNNEFYVIGGRLTKIKVEGTGYVPNHIKFIRNTFEASSLAKVEMEFQRCHHVKILDARFEGVDSESTILFGAGARSCDIIGDWSGQSSPRADFNGPLFAVTDLGQGNYVGKDRLERFDRSLVLDINGASKIVANATESDCADGRIGSLMSPLINKPYIVPHFNGFSIGANRYLGLSEFLPVRYGDSLSYNFDYDHSNLRLAIFCYDVNMNLMQDVSGGTELFSQPSVTFSTAYSAYTVGPAAASYFNDISGSVVSPNVKYIRVGLFATTSGYYRHVGVNLHTQKHTENKRISFAKLKQKDMALSSPPTMGIASVGDSINDSASGGKYICTMFKEAFTEMGFSSGLSVISANGSLGASVGDIVGIQLSSGLTQWTSVKSISSGSIVIDPLVGDVAVGARVVFIRWKPTIVMQTMSYDPPSIPAKGTHSVIVDVPGALFVNSVVASFNRFNANISVDASVSAADKVTVNFRNHGDSAVDLSSGQITVRLFT